MGWHLDGRVTAVVGTHTHVQTADERILPKGTACLTDAGMTGPHDSIIGVTDRGRARPVRERDAGEIRSRDRAGTAQRRHRHGRSDDRPCHRHRAPESLGGRGRGARRGNAGAACADARCLTSSPSHSKTIDNRQPTRTSGASSRSRSSRTSIRGLLETGFGDLWVEGEISNCRVWNTGHMYFTLKDGGAQIKAVMYPLGGALSEVQGRGRAARRRARPARRLRAERASTSCSAITCSRKASARCSWPSSS